MCTYNAPRPAHCSTLCEQQNSQGAWGIGPVCHQGWASVLYMLLVVDFLVCWLKKEIWRTAVYLRTTCCFLLFWLETKLLFVSAWTKKFVWFINVEGGVLVTSQFDPWINKGGWEEVEALALEVPIPINFLLLDIIIDWLKQWFFALKLWFFHGAMKVFHAFHGFLHAHQPSIV